jgi:type II secretory pathway pseudopilin PulG
MIRQRGVTLVELILVVGLLSAMTLLSFYEKQYDLEQAKARIVGSMIFQYNNAVRESLSTDIPASSATYVGSSWLKSSACGGLLPPGQEYLPCSFPMATTVNPVPFGNLAFTTAVAVSGTPPNRQYIATTSTSAFTVGDSPAAMKVRADLSGIAVLAAASAIGGGIQSSGGGASPIAATSDARFTSDPQTGIMTFISSNNAATDVWLRTDGGNSMHKTLNFDGSAFADRQIAGASRIQNLAGQALFLGSGSGLTAVTAAGVVVDTNAEILGGFRVRGSSQVDGNEFVNGAISANGQITSNANVVAGVGVIGRWFSDGDDGNYYLDPNGTSRQNSVLANTSYAAVFYDINNSAFYVQPASTSRLNAVQSNVEYSGIYYDINNTGYYVQPSQTSRMNAVMANTSFASIFYDINNTGYYVQPASSSHLNGLVSNNIYNAGRVEIGEFLQLDAVSTVGWGCSPNGLQSRDATGKLLSCINGLWAAGSGVSGQYTASGWSVGAIGFVSGPKPLLVQVTGGSDLGCGGDGPNRYHLAGIVNGLGAVAQAQNANYAYTKTGFISFGVPANTYYEIQSSPYACGPGSFTYFAFEL